MANTYEFNFSLCHTAGFKALDLKARYEHKNGVTYGLRVAERNGTGMERKVLSAAKSCSIIQVE